MGIVVEPGSFWDKAGTRMLLVDPRAFPYIWEDIEPCFDGLDKLVPRYFCKDDVPELVCVGRMQLWVFYNLHKVAFAGLTEIIRYPRVKECSVTYAGGTNVRVAVPFIEIIEAWAQQRGCDRLMLGGRKGWIRLFARYGYRNIAKSCLHKELRR